jgi:hypothetical protein
LTVAGVIAKNGDVDVFGKPLDQTVALRERSPAFEQQTRATGGEAIKERVQSPTDPEILFDVLFGCPEPVPGADEQIAAISGSGGQHCLEPFCHLVADASVFS